MPELRAGDMVRNLSALMASFNMCWNIWPSGRGIVA